MRTETNATTRTTDRTTRPDWKQTLLLVALTLAATVVHGYHPYVEDAEIYLPGIKKLLVPSLYPKNAEFFASHAGMTLFPNLIAASVRITHIPFDWALLFWQLGCVFLLLFAAWKIGRIVFGDSLAAWGGAVSIAALLTMPVAGTALYIMDQYLTPRSFSAGTVLMLVACVVERRYKTATVWALITACIHPLMVVFGVSYALTLVLVRYRFPLRDLAFAAAIPFFPPVTQAYHEAVQTRGYFFLQRWAWYEWLGLVAPFAIIWLFEHVAEKQGWPKLKLMCRALNIFGVVFAAGSLLTIPTIFERFALLEPMRYLHLTYILMFIFAGGMLAKFLLRRVVWRWLVLFVPVSLGMFFAQREIFAGSQHLELPWIRSSNPWVQAFLWIRQNTPQDAFFALNPNHMVVPGEDQHGFRAIAERSMLADNIKDSGAVSMFPGIAETWREQTRAQQNWKNFQLSDFESLKSKYSVDWVVLEKPTNIDLDCPYQNETLSVCRLPRNAISTIR